ncbi:hypothetical protein AU255_02535 [Methyloprofundus sedimenti]|uniref:Uncharacterized protein n=1 Tax=Methyloprofundus sedimenti TaxID=1420851 RepID=A0A1V8M5G4_9GAMM|nr:hypothetical protein [Methyloprofundus sedimenti]OQK16802.1 hypothetical protein AU255_02535 [Methyloprofundus sedimenti]
MFKKAIISSLLLASSFTALAEEEAHLHAGDLQPWRIGAEINLNSQLFEVDFGDLGGGAFATDEPGVDVNVEKGAFQPGNWLQFQLQGQLLFWDGDEWTTAMPNEEHVNIIDALDNTVSIDAHGVSEGLAVIGEIDANGALHAHIDFSLLDASNNLNGSQGAYRIELKLFESAANSDLSVSYAAKPVVIVFNQGLEEAEFEHAIEALGDDPHEAVIYDDVSGILSILEVKAFGRHYKVELQDQGDFLFKLTDAEEISE